MVSTLKRIYLKSCCQVLSRSFIVVYHRWESIHSQKFFFFFFLDFVLLRLLWLRALFVCLFLFCCWLVSLEHVRFLLGRGARAFLLQQELTTKSTTEWTAVLCWTGLRISIVVWWGVSGINHFLGGGNFHGNFAKFTLNFASKFIRKFRPRNF